MMTKTLSFLAVLSGCSGRTTAAGITQPALTATRVSTRLSTPRSCTHAHTAHSHNTLLHTH